MTSKAFFLAGLAVCMLIVPAYAHHSFAMFDPDITIEIQGEVTELRWTNPHAWLFLVVMDDQGQTAEWGFEMGAPNGLVRSGWRPRTVIPGDEVSVRAHPLRDGRTAGQLLSLTLPNGETLGDPSIGEP